MDSLELEESVVTRIVSMLVVLNGLNAMKLLGWIIFGIV